MDARIIRTRYRIREAFLSLRKKLMPENIKVADICQKAMINKTTFYKHYNDSNELSREIEDHYVDKLISEFSEKDRITESPRDFVEGFIKAVIKEAEGLRRVFRGKREILAMKFEKKLRELILKSGKDVEDGIVLIFALGGFVSVVNEYIFSEAQVDISELTTRLSGVIAKVTA